MRKWRMAGMVLGSLTLASVGARAADTVTLRELIGQLADLEALARLPDPLYRQAQSSSYDRKSRTPEDPAGWFANADRGHYLRVEENRGRREHVMLDAAGPGCVVRIWSANPQGTLRVYIDGAEEPALEADMGELLRGRVKPFVPPLGAELSRGCNLYFPIPYLAHCKITSDRGDFYYHVNYRTWPKGTAVESFSPQGLAAARESIDRVKALLEAPERVVSRTRGNREKKVEKARVSSGRVVLFHEASSGPGAVRELAIRLEADDLPAALRKVRLVGRFDGEKTIDAPVGDFFGSAPGLNPYRSLPLEMREDGWLVSRWVMPFERELHLEALVADAGPVEISARVVHGPWRWDERSLHFHARWHAEHDMATNPPRDWNYVDLRGKGQYVGNVLSVANPVKAWWGEGDEKIRIDGESFPSHFGTGTEDYYGYAWCSPQPFAHPFHDQTRCDGPGNFGHTSVNRWHILDAIPFERSFRFDIEVWHWDRGIRVSYATVNYWYARPGAVDATPEIRPEDLRIPDLPVRRVWLAKGAIEGEKMKIIEKSGSPESQDMEAFGGGKWSGGAHLWWRGAHPGDGLVLGFPAPRAGRFRVFGRFTKAVDYGICQLLVNGQKAGEPIDFYHDGVVGTDPVDLGIHELTEKENRLSVVITGTNPAARPKNYMFGLDYLRLQPVEESAEGGAK